MAERRFRIAAVIEQEYAPGEWIGKIGREIAIIEDDGSDPGITPERMLEDIATALEIKMKEIEAEEGTAEQPWIDFRERRPENGQECEAVYLIKGMKPRKIIGPYRADTDYIHGDGVGISLGPLAVWLFWRPSTSGMPTPEQTAAATADQGGGD